MSKKKQNSLRYVLVAAVAIIILVVWFKDDDEKSNNRYSNQSPTQLRNPLSNSTSEPPPQTATNADGTNDTSAGVNNEAKSKLPAVKGYQFEDRKKMKQAEAFRLYQVERAVDSVIMYRNLREELAPKVEMEVLKAMEEYDNPYFHATYADLLFVTRRFKEAVAQYELAFEEMGNIDDFKKNYAKAAYAYGTLRSQNGDYQLAIDMFERVQELQPDIAGNQLDTNLYMCYAQDAFFKLEEKKAREALPSITKGLKVDDSRFAMNFYAARAHQILGNFEKAIQYGEKCKNLNREHVPTRQILYNAYRAVGDSAKMREIMIK